MSRQARRRNSLGIARAPPGRLGATPWAAPEGAREITRVWRTMLALVPERDQRGPGDAEAVTAARAAASSCTDAIGPRRPRQRQSGGDSESVCPGPGVIMMNRDYHDRPTVY